LTAVDQEWRRLRLVVLIVYAITIAIALRRHAMWADEAQAWLIARDSPTLAALFSNLRYEGHPALWYLLLWPLARISADPALMQMLSGAIAVFTIAIVLWRSPFTSAEKLLFPFGYFPLYEYSVKSRSYGLGLLLIVLICAAWPTRKARPIRMALLLALLANVHVLFMLVSAAFLGALVLERIRRRGSESADHPAPGTALAALAIVLAGWAAAFVVAWPPADSGFALGWVLRPSASRLWQVVGGLDPYAASSGFVLAVAAIGMFRMRRDIVVGAFLGVAVTAIVAFLYLKYIGFIWQRGAIFAAVVAASWISRARGTALFPRFVVPVFFAVQAMAGLQALTVDLLHPLSTGRAVAAFLEEKGWSHAPLIAVHDNATSPVLAYLERDRAFYPYSDAACHCRGAGRWGSFTIWDRMRVPEPDDAAILDAAGSLGPEAIILIPLTRSDMKLQAAGFRLIQRFPDQRDGLTFGLYRRADSMIRR
jgi:hypothetical protein